jgi:aminoglycoside phosphotransferase (APT) family kinase protein
MAARADDPIYAPELAAALIARDCPELVPVRISRFGRGWDHDVFVVNDRWVFRFPRNAPAAEAIEVERELLPWLAPHLPCPIPRPRYHGTLDGRPGWNFAGYALLPGTTICDAPLDAGQRARLAPALGKFLRALHVLDPADSPVALPVERLRRLDVGYRVPQTRERLLLLGRSGKLSEAVVEKLLRASEPPAELLPADREVIVHCDVHRRNVLVDGSGGLSGIIDWVDVHRGHRVHDLVAPFAILPPRAREVFFEHYGSVDSATLCWARWRAINHTAGALAGAIERGDPAFETASREALMEIAGEE